MRIEEIAAHQSSAYQAEIRARDDELVAASSSEMHIEQKALVLKTEMSLMNATALGHRRKPCK